MDSVHYRDKAQQCRRLARDVTARDVAERLTALAEEYEAEAEAAEETPEDSNSQA